MSEPTRPGSFDASELALRLYRERVGIFARITASQAIERYLVSTRSRREYVAFYRIRVPRIQAERIYRLLTRHMGRQTCPSIAEALAAISKITGTVELSNASKLIASLDRDKAVFDEKVRAKLGLRRPAGDAKRSIRIYSELSDRMTALLREKHVKRTIRDFDAKFSQMRGSKFLTRMKKLDFMLWQMS